MRKITAGWIFSEGSRGVALFFLLLALCGFVSWVGEKRSFNLEKRKIGVFPSFFLHSWFGLLMLSLRTSQQLVARHSHYLSTGNLECVERELDLWSIFRIERGPIR